MNRLYEVPRRASWEELFAKFQGSDKRQSKIVSALKLRTPSGVRSTTKLADLEEEIPTGK